jgi:hypothetical protein
MMITSVFYPMIALAEYPISSKLCYACFLAALPNRRSTLWPTILPPNERHPRQNQSELVDDLGRRCSTLKLLSAQLTHPAI